MPTIKRLPGPDDGADGLRHLIELFGDEQVFQLIRLCRQDNGPGKRPGSDVSTEIARRLVAAAGGDTDETRRSVADDLGYKPTARTNFYKILAGTPRRSLGRR